jgi:hypothetical protein
LFIHLGALNERIEDIEHAVAAPGVGVVSKNLNFFSIVSFPGDAVTVATEAIELVDEFINDIPRPVVL